MEFKLFHKLLLFSVLLAVIPLGILGSISLQSTEAELKSAVNDELLQTAQGLADSIDNYFIDQWSAPLELMARTLASPDLPPSAKLALLTNVSALPDIVALQISTAEGEPVLILHDDIAARIREMGESPNRLLLVPHPRLVGPDDSGLGTGKVLSIPSPQLDLLSIVRPIEGPAASAGTLLSARVNLARLRERLEQHPFSANGRILLLDQQGQPLFGATSDILDANPFTRRLAELRALGGASVGVMPFRTSGGRQVLGGYALASSLGWTLVVERDAHTAYQPVRRMRDHLLMWISLGVLLAGLGAWFISRRISTPIVTIERTAKRVGDGDLDTAVPALHRRDEIGRLAERMNEMIRGLRDREHIKDVFGRYQNVEVMRTLLETPGALALGGERREITAMMTDLRGFTAISEALSPEDVVRMLNRYFEPMVDIVQRHGGTIDDILGDGMFIMFGAPLRLADHAQRAVACAIDMQLAMAQINHDNQASGLPAIEMGIGLNTGEVIIGNIGSEKRAKFSAVGSPVNLSARVESYTVGGQVLVSESVYQPLIDVLEIGKVMEVRAKGIKSSLTIIEVLGIGGQYQLRLPLVAEPLRRLAQGIAVQLTLFEGKSAEEDAIHCSLIALGQREAELLLSPALEPLTNIKLRIEEPGLCEGEIYAKVTDLTLQGNRIRFTRLPDEARAYLQSLSAQGQPE